MAIHGDNGPEYLNAAIVTRAQTWLKLKNTFTQENLRRTPAWDGELQSRTPKQGIGLNHTKTMAGHGGIISLFLPSIKNGRVPKNHDN